MTSAAALGLGSGLSRPLTGPQLSGRLAPGTERGGRPRKCVGASTVTDFKWLLGPGAVQFRAWAGPGRAAGALPVTEPRSPGSPGPGCHSAAEHLQTSGTLVPYDITYYITLSFTVYDIIYDKSSL